MEHVTGVAARVPRDFLAENTEYWKAVSGLYEKIKAAEAWGFKKVLIPQRNLEHSVNPEDFEIEVVGCSNLDDYLSHILVDDEEGVIAEEVRDEASG